MQHNALIWEVFFVSDSTGITAQALGDALLVQFPHLEFKRHTIPFLTTVEATQQAVQQINQVAQRGATPLVFSTAVQDEIRNIILQADALVIDLFATHLSQLETLLGQASARSTAQLHSMTNLEKYNHRMQAIEFAIEHDDGQSLRALERSDVILIAPSRCGKTPTSMYLALQHGLFVANYPLVDEDFENLDLPRPIRHLRHKLFGITTSASRLSEVRGQRRPDSRYASFQQVSFELRSAKTMFKRHQIPFVDSSAKSVEEMSTVILQHIGVDTVPG